SKGVVAHLVEKWQTAVIFNKLSGSPTTFTPGSCSFTSSTASTSTACTYNGIGTNPIQLGPLPGGSVHFSGNSVLYFDGLTQVPDPSIKNMPASLQPLANLYALAGPDGKIILQNPVAGSLGGLSPTSYRGLGSFTFNMQLSKAITISQERGITLRVRADATNLLNKPIWGSPSLNIDSITGFGLITSATGNRSIQLGARVDF